MNNGESIILDKIVKSPINYTGNKFRLLNTFRPIFPSECNRFIDLFCGGATVGFNIRAKQVVLFDANSRVISLLDDISTCEIDDMIGLIKDIINKYKLSNSMDNGYKSYHDYVIGNNGLKEYNKEGFYKLRSDYNNLEDKNSYLANVMLYVLMVYGFNNDIRFNAYGNFNLPVGKTDFNKNNYSKLIEFNKRAKEISFNFVCDSFENLFINVKNLTCNDFVYCDPPYLITNAVYNESNGWSEAMEKKLLNLLTQLDEQGVKFALSNMIKKEGRTNVLLEEWAKKYNVHPIAYNYKSASYNKKNRNSNEEEVLITNY